jgi:hypothetical protein
MTIIEKRTKVRIILWLTVLGMAGAVYALGPVPGSDNAIQVLISGGSTVVRINGAALLVDGATTLAGAVTLPAGTTFTNPAVSGLTGTLTAPTISSPVITGLSVNTPQAFSIADDAAGTSPAGTLTPTSGVVIATCLDSDNCTMVLGETGMVSGMVVKIIGGGAPTIAVADSAGVTELTGTITLGANDSLSLVYATDRWVELSTSDN